METQGRSYKNHSEEMPERQTGEQTDSNALPETDKERMQQ